MAFESKRLRVQLPCGQVTVVEETPQITPPIHFTPTACFFHTTHPPCIWNSFCTPGTFPQCLFGSQPIACQFGSPVPPGTPVFTDTPIQQQGHLAVDAAHLPAMRAQLEAQLADVAAAQKAVDEHQG